MTIEVRRQMSHKFQWSLETSGLQLQGNSIVYNGCYKTNSLAERNVNALACGKWYTQKQKKELSRRLKSTHIAHYARKINETNRCKRQWIQWSQAKQTDGQQ